MQWADHNHLYNTTTSDTQQTITRRALTEMAYTAKSPSTANHKHQSCTLDRPLSTQYRTGDDEKLRRDKAGWAWMPAVAGMSTGDSGEEIWQCAAYMGPLSISSSHLTAPQWQIPRLRLQALTWWRWKQWAPWKDGIEKEEFSQICHPTPFCRLGKKLSVSGCQMGSVFIAG